MFLDKKSEWKKGEKDAKIEIRFGSDLIGNGEKKSVREGTYSPRWQMFERIFREFLPLEIEVNGE